SEYIHSEASKEENTGYIDKGHFLPSPRNLKPGSEDRDEPQTIRKQGRTGSEHQVKNSLKSIYFLVLHNKLGLASDNQDSDSGSSSREQSSSEHDQLRKHEKHGNMANQHLPGHAEHPLGAFSLHHEHNTCNITKMLLACLKKNLKVMKRNAWKKRMRNGMKKLITETQSTKTIRHVKQHENTMQFDELLRDSSQPTRKTKRHSKKSDLEEEERENRKKSYKEEIPPSQKTRPEYQDAKQQSQERKHNIQVNSQSDRDTVVKIQVREDSNDDDGHDSGDTDGEEYLSNTWKETAYEEEQRIKSNDQESTSTEPEGEGTTEDDTAVHKETEDFQIVKIKDLAHSEQDDHEPPDSDNKQLKMSSSIQNMNSMDSDNKYLTNIWLYPITSNSPSFLLGLPDKCRNFHCKRGKVCHTDKQGEPHCFCQDPATCPPTEDYEHVCGTDNKTYDGTCQLFGTKYIPPCTDYEVDQFPLQMRDWLKNILIEYYERQIFNPKQKITISVKTIYRNDKRLVAGDHPVKLLLHDFEKNYHILLTYSEFAPLRASLVPMEHCITRFFKECDGDQDKLIALKEWCHCFGIKEAEFHRIFTEDDKDICFKAGKHILLSESVSSQFPSLAALRARILTPVGSPFLSHQLDEVAVTRIQLKLLTDVNPLHRSSIITCFQRHGTLQLPVPYLVTIGSAAWFGPQRPNNPLPELGNAQCVILDMG
ncbi:hypothetical protein DV515_00008541, partial [Chloebia gouldiae]